MPTELAGERESGRRGWAARLARVESRNVTFAAGLPPFWTEARGSRVRDADGRELLDLCGAFGVAFAGHRHPLVTGRIVEQAGRLVHGMGDIHPPTVKVEFLERLAGLMPWPDARAVLGLSGSDAVEAALKTALLATGKPGIVAFEGAYHGSTLGALAATYREHFRGPFLERLADHVRFAPFPGSAAEAEASLDRVAALLEGGAPAPVGAVIVEPVQGRAGVRVPPEGFLSSLRACARARGALLIADEVFTGMGRTGTLLACERDGAAPDLVCLGKALGGGMPLSACVGPARVMDAWPASTGEAVHTSTFLGHPLGCAAGLGFLEALERDDLVARARRLGAWARGRLAARLDGCGGVAEVRGRGLMLGVELAAGGGAGAAGLAARGPGPAARVAEAALERGVIVLPAGGRGEVVEITPAATIARADLERGLDVVAEAVAQVAAGA